jgi:N-acetylglucosamine-6-phosphate deacetylase
MRLGVEAAIIEGIAEGRLAPGDVEIEDGRVAAVGLGDRGIARLARRGGGWRVGRAEVDVHAGGVRGSAGELAGSVPTMPEAIRDPMRAGATLEQAVDAAPGVPARVARRPGLGMPRLGGRADLVALDGDVEVLRTPAGGLER